jgi:ABC-type glycerol-3-phosphate transport system substrate-binding protein
MRKLSSVLALLMVVAMLVSACAGAAPAAPAADAGAAPAADAAAEATVDPNAPTPVPTPVVNAFGTCDDPLVLWHGLTGTDGAVFATLLEQFAAANPDVCVASEGYPWDIFFQKYPTAVAAGTPPDMVIFHAGEVAQMASQGLMTPLDDVIYNDGTLNKADFNETVINAVSWDGQTMAVPFDNHGWLMWYNTELVEAAGLDPNVLPANGEEFIAWAQQITTDANGLHPNEEGFDKDNVAVWAFNYSWPRFTIPSTLWQFGGSVISEDGTTATLNSPEAIAAVQFWHDLIYKHRVVPEPIPGSMGAQDLYRNGMLAAMWEGTWTRGMMLDNPELDAVTKTAFVNSLAPDGNQAVKMDAHIMAVPAGTDDAGIAKAKTLMAFLANNGAAWATSGQVPAKIAVQSEPEVQAIPSVAMAAEQFNAIGRTDFSHPAFIEIQTAWETAVGNALSSADSDVAAALEAGNQQIQAILDRP